jgi:hypothetical protein
MSDHAEYLARISAHLITRPKPDKVVIPEACDDRDEYVRRFDVANKLIHTPPVPRK